MKSAVFFVDRANYVRFYAPVIEAFLHAGWTVTCLHNFSCTESDYRFPSFETLQIKSERLVQLAFHSDAEVGQRLTSIEPHVLLGLEPRAVLERRFGPLHWPLAVLQTAIDTLLYWRQWGVGAVEDERAKSDIFCMSGHGWLEWAEQYFEAVDLSTELKSQILPRTRITGMPELDALARISRNAIRSRLGVTDDRSVVLFFPITLANQHGLWPRLFGQRSRLQQLMLMIRERDFSHLDMMVRGVNERALTTAIRSFCDRNGALLVLKARKKDPVRAEVAKAADHVFYDEAEYPGTTLELLMAADMCIHFYSSVAQEAAFANCPALCIARPSWIPSGEVALETRMWRHGEKGHFFNTLGVNSWFTMAEAIERLPNLRIEDFAIDNDSRAAYVRRWLGYDDKRSGERVVEAVEPLAGKSAILASQIV